MGMFRLDFVAFVSRGVMVGLTSGFTSNLHFINVKATDMSQEKKDIRRSTSPLYTVSWRENRTGIAATKTAEMASALQIAPYFAMTVKSTLPL